MSEKIRKVTESDREDILEISRHIWEGHDYLPSVIEEWLKDSHSYTCGIEVEDQFVALANLRVIEGGRTGWMEGLRVHPDHRGKGYANALTEYLIEKAVELGVQRLRYTTSNENEASLRLAEKYGFKSILEMGVFWHPNPKTVPSTKSCLHVRKSNSNEVYAMLQRKPDIIPNNVLIYDWKALDVTPEALEVIGESHEYYITMKKAEVDSLSYGYSGRRGGLSLWTFTIYATESDGFLLQLSHNVALALKQGYNAVMCTYQLGFERKLYEVDWISENRWGTHLVLLERTLL